MINKQETTKLELCYESQRRDSIRNKLLLRGLYDKIMWVDEIDNSCIGKQIFVLGRIRRLRNSLVIANDQYFDSFSLPLRTNSLDDSRVDQEVILKVEVIQNVSLFPGQISSYGPVSVLREIENEFSELKPLNKYSEAQKVLDYENNNNGGLN